MFHNPSIIFCKQKLHVLWMREQWGMAVFTVSKSAMSEFEFAGPKRRKVSRGGSLNPLLTLFLMPLQTNNTVFYTLVGWLGVRWASSMSVSHKNSHVEVKYKRYEWMNY